jgi:hypothetical protein
MNKNIEDLHIYVPYYVENCNVMCFLLQQKKEKNTTIVLALIKRLDQQF